MNPTTELSSLSIFFPAYNEAANLEETVKKAVEVAEKYANDYEVIVVNDGSKDNTIEVVSKLVTNNPKVRLITHEVNQGYGGALMTGYSNSTKDWVFFSDADLQFDLTEIEKLIEKTNQTDVVLGYRIKRSDPFLRYLNAKGWNILNRLLFGLKVIDIDCAFKLIKNSAIKKVLPNMISIKGAMISAELLIRLKRAGYNFIEIGVHHYPRKVGSSTGAKPEVIIRAFRELWNVYLSDLGSPFIRKLFNH